MQTPIQMSVRARPVAPKGASLDKGVRGVGWKPACDFDVLFHGMGNRVATEKPVRKDP